VLSSARGFRPGASLPELRLGTRAFLQAKRPPDGGLDRIAFRVPKKLLETAPEARPLFVVGTSRRPVSALGPSVLARPLDSEWNR